MRVRLLSGAQVASRHVGDPFEAPQVPSQQDPSRHKPPKTPPQRRASPLATLQTPPQLIASSPAPPEAGASTLHHLVQEAPSELKTSPPSFQDPKTTRRARRHDDQEPPIEAVYVTTQPRPSSAAMQAVASRLGAKSPRFPPSSPDSLDIQRERQARQLASSTKRSSKNQGTNLLDSKRAPTMISSYPYSIQLTPIERFTVIYAKTPYGLPGTSSLFRVADRVRVIVSGHVVGFFGSLGKNSAWPML